MQDRASFLDRLNAVHDFPDRYTFKVIGENDESFIARVVQACVNVLGPDADPEVSTRESSGGKHLSVTVVVGVDVAEDVLGVYDLFQTMEGVRFVL